MFGQLDQAARVSIFLTFLLYCVPVSAAGGNDDPFEPYNRVMFTVNDTADRFLFKPLAQGYKAVTPDPAEHGIDRMLQNLGEVVNVSNDLLQGKFVQAANDSGRFVINSTVGLAGFFDVARDLGLKRSEGEDFGQTLGRWGVKSGPYLVLPLLGSSTLRDGPARFVDSFINPVNEIDHIPTRNSIYGTDFLNTRVQLLDAEQLVSGDKYSFIRDIYLQRREYLVNDGQSEDSFGDDFGDYNDGFTDEYGYE